MREQNRKPGSCRDSWIECQLKLDTILEKLEKIENSCKGVCKKCDENLNTGESNERD